MSDSNKELIPIGDARISRPSSELAKRGLDLISREKIQTFDQSSAIRSFEGIGDRSCVALSADGEHVVVRHYGWYKGREKKELNVTVWNTQNGLKEYWNFEPRNPDGNRQSWDRINSVDISQDKKYLLTVSGKRLGTWGDVKVWDIQSGYELKLLDFGWGSTAKFLPNGQSVMIARPGGLLLRDMQSGKVLRRFAANMGFSNKMAISQEGTRIIVRNGNYLVVYDLATGRRIHSHYVMNGKPGEMGLSPEGQVAFGWSGVLYHLNTNTNKRRFLCRIMNGQSSGFGVSVDYSDPNYVVAGSFDNKTMIIWGLIDDREIARYAHKNAVVSVKYLPEKKQLLSACWDGSVYLWDASYLRSE